MLYAITRKYHDKNTSDRETREATNVIAGLILHDIGFRITKADEEQDDPVQSAIDRVI